METVNNRQPLVSAAAFVVVVAGMQAAREIVVPFLMACFVAILCGPPVAWLVRRRVPRGGAMTLVLLSVVGVGGLVMAGAWSSVRKLAALMPSYKERLAQELEVLKQSIDGWDVPFKDHLQVSPASLLESVDPGKALDLMATFTGQLGGLFGNAFLILLLVIFLLVESSGIRHKVGRPGSDSEASLQRFDHALTEINRYMGLKTLVSLITGVSVAVWLAILGLEFPLLWGMSAFLLNFVPNLGSILSAVPPVLLGFLQAGTPLAGGVALAFVVINVLVGSVLEPRLLGRGLGLSTLVVFLSLVVWGWVLGPVGMVLSVPLTMTIKIILESSPGGRVWAGWLGPPTSELPASQAVESLGVSG